MKKRNDLHIYLFALGCFFLILASSCAEEKESAPELNTSPVTYVSEQTVTFSGTVTNDGGAAVTERGICWSTSHNPSTASEKIPNGIGTGSFTCTLTGLLTNTPYFVRAYAINSAGTGYGPEMAFRTWNDELVMDIDGNLYHTVTIGSHVWLVENLKVTHYRNGDEVELITGNAAWEGITSGAYSNYDHSSGNAEIYGRLYNWFAVNDGRNIAPEGWHVSSDEDWSDLSGSQGGDAVAGSKLKEAGTIHWREPNADATNESGFSALPGGHREYGGSFDYINWGGGWWCSTEENSNDAWIRYMDYGAFDTWRALEDKRYGRSVRCVKD
ncbi:MAG: FISUMP domain-containing protein [Bacteroidota bacterium]